MEEILIMHFAVVSLFLSILVIARIHVGVIVTTSFILSFNHYLFLTGNFPLFNSLMDTAIVQGLLIATTAMVFLYMVLMFHSYQRNWTKH